MAAHSSNFIRLRLHFDYPPPAVVDCRMCWLLVDLNKCRVVADLESIIREKFEFSRGSILSLFLEDCYLPHTESIYVVRDNDSIRVKVDCVAQVNGHDSRLSARTKNCRKRHRVAEEDGPDEREVSVERKKKKKKRSEESPAEGAERVPCHDGGKSRVKHAEKKKKKKKKKDAEEKSPAATPDPAPSPKKPQKASVKSSKNPQVAQAKAPKASSSDSSSSSEEDKAPKKPAAKKLPSTPTAPKAALNAKPALKKPNPPSSSSSDSSSSNEATSVKIQPPKNKPLNAPEAPSVSLQPTNCAQKPAGSAVPPPRDKEAESDDSDSEEEIQLVIKRPLAQPVLGGQFPWRGRGRGNPRWGGAGGGGGGPPGERGRGAGRGRVRGNGGGFEPCYNGTRESSYHTDTLTNKSAIFQNKPESAPKPDYSSMPLLAAPPQVGQKIAFKLLELTENYTPEVSEYKEGKMMSFDPTTKQIEIELLNACQAPVEPGKFDLVYQNPDGSESVEYTVSRGSWVTERWESLLEPRLII
ncbi:coilin [Mugil cephalus]|uniref:coilin n=1 Tax=Mugil cephalus TaxID=48193 RepID=UPI001FB6B00B|nr:coilin [Mugil cephalus]